MGRERLFYPDADGKTVYAFDGPRINPQFEIRHYYSHTVGGIYAPNTDRAFDAQFTADAGMSPRDYTQGAQRAVARSGEGVRSTAGSTLSPGEAKKLLAEGTNLARQLYETNLGERALSIARRLGEIVARDPGRSFTVQGITASAQTLAAMAISQGVNNRPEVTTAFYQGMRAAPAPGRDAKAAAPAPLTPQQEAQIAVLQAATILLDPAQSFEAKTDASYKLGQAAKRLSGTAGPSSFLVLPDNEAALRKTLETLPIPEKGKQQLLLLVQEDIKARATLQRVLDTPLSGDAQAQEEQKEAKAEAQETLNGWVKPTSFTGMSELLTGLGLVKEHRDVRDAAYLNAAFAAGAGKPVPETDKRPMLNISSQTVKGAIFLALSERPEIKQEIASILADAKATVDGLPDRALQKRYVEEGLLKPGEIKRQNISTSAGQAIAAQALTLFAKANEDGNLSAEDLRTLHTLRTAIADSFKGKPINLPKPEPYASSENLATQLQARITALQPPAR